MRANLDPSMTFTFAQEGDEQVSLDPADDGNWSSGREGDGTLIGTRFGVSAPALIRYLAPAVVTAETMAALPKTTAETILSSQFWQAMRCDDMPAGVDLSLNDHGFNAGDSASVRLLQGLLGFAGDDLDGWAGDDTVAATQAFNAAPLAPRLSNFALRAAQTRLGPLYAGAIDGEYGPKTAAGVAACNDNAVVLCAALFDRQIAAYQGMAKFPVFGRGWVSRCQARLGAALALTAAA